MKLLTRGNNREIYDYDENTVLKIPKNEKSCKCNLTEYNNWLIVKDTKYAKWFAPCIKLVNNYFLYMRKVEKIDMSNYIEPFYVPSFLKDIKLKNWGIYNNHWVLCDYTSIKPITDKMKLFNPNKLLKK